MKEMTTAIVTGAAGGIGRAICLELANRGHRIIAIDRNGEALVQVSEELAAQGKVIRPVVMDLSDTAALDAFAAELNNIKILVNNAGIFEVKPFAALKPEDFRMHYEVNVVASTALIHRVLPHMTPGASILNMASVAMFGSPYSAHYAASKAAVGALTTTLSLELSSRQIRVNAIAPGAIKTPMLLGRNDDFSTDIVSRVPLGRLGEPEDVANAVGFLTSDQASYITGVVLVVDGGVRH